VFANKVFRRTFGPKRDEIKKEWRKRHNEELYDPYCSPNILRVIKSRRMSWAGHVTRMGGGRVVYRVWWGNLRERDLWGDSGVDGKIIIEWIFKKWDWV
jgi:hypothetical protein